MQRQGARMLGAAFALLAGWGAIARAADTQWPMYRHDPRLTGSTDAAGKIVRPQVLWQHSLGIPHQPLASHDDADRSLYDLDGDGSRERFTVEGSTLRVTDAAGAELGRVEVDGGPLGQVVRVAKLFPLRPGLQVIAFSQRMDTGAGQGHCFTFHRGLGRGELAWSTGPLEHYYSPTLIVDDLDGDGLPEIVAAPHYRVQIFSGQTGRLKAEVPWDVGRNYGVLISRPRPGALYRDLFIVCDFVLHVDAIRNANGQWTHAWGHKYIEPNSPTPEGREQALRVGPNPVCDLDGDGRDEMIYSLADAATGGGWHLRIRDAETGAVRHDLPRTWLWSVRDLDGDGRPEVLYTPTGERRAAKYCDLHVAQLTESGLVDRGALRHVRPLITGAELPPTIDSIADEGTIDLLYADLDGSGSPALFAALPDQTASHEDALIGVRLTAKGELREAWRYARPGERLNLLHAGPGARGEFVARVRALDAGTEAVVNASGAVVSESKIAGPANFTTTPIVVDLDADGRNEIVVQNAAEQVTALRFEPGEAEPKRLWSLPGVAMSPRGGYDPNGAWCVQAADLDEDGRPEVLFAFEDAGGGAGLACADGGGTVRWRRVFDDCPWGGRQAGVNAWICGRFAGRARGLDVYVDVHRRGKVSNEGYVLSGDDGTILWHRRGVAAGSSAMPFGGGLPAVADLDGDGADDLSAMFWTIYAAVSGRTGEPLHPPAYLPGPQHFNRWLAYSSPTLADLDADGRLDVYLNSAANSRGAYAAVQHDGTPLWAEFHDFSEGSNGFGPVSDLDGDGKLEVVVPVTNGTLTCLDGATGKRRWTVPVPVTGDVIAVDVDGAEGRDLVFSGTDGRMWAVRGRDGSTLWTIDAPGRPVAGDVDGDGAIELLSVGPHGMLRIVGNGPPAQ